MTRLDIRTGSRTKDNGAQEVACCKNCQKAKTIRRRDATKSFQYWTVARLARRTDGSLKNRHSELQLQSPATHLRGFSVDAFSISFGA
jgi:hypothetical protein